MGTNNAATHGWRPKFNSVNRDQLRDSDSKQSKVIDRVKLLNKIKEDDEN